MKFSRADFENNADRILDHAMESGETIEVELEGSVVRMAVSDPSLNLGWADHRIQGAVSQSMIEEERNSRDEFPGASWVESV